VFGPAELARGEDAGQQGVLLRQQFLSSENVDEGTNVLGDVLVVELPRES